MRCDIKIQSRSTRLTNKQELQLMQARLAQMEEEKHQACLDFSNSQAVAELGALNQVVANRESTSDVVDPET